MSTQRKLNALLFELQTAGSPLAQAKILARAWRTVRELSPTDRKLLGRHAGFDGAEEILEGLARKKGGMAPAMLLQMLSNARTTDASTLRNLLSAFRDPSRRDEAVSQSLDLAAELMKNKEAEEEVEEALYELQAVEAEDGRDPDESGDPPESDPESSTEIEPEIQPEAPAVPPVPPVVSEPETIPKKLRPPKPAAVDWSRWDSARRSPRPMATPRAERRATVSTSGPRRFGEVAAVTAVGIESTVLGRLRALQGALADLADSNNETLGDLVEVFPDGWSRRRAVSALIEAGIPASADDAVTLVASSFDRELDRRWCLGVLAARGDLRGATLERATELLESPSARRRLAASARG
jgi:hypothetical protein